MAPSLESELLGDAEGRAFGFGAAEPPPQQFGGAMNLSSQAGIQLSYSRSAVRMVDRMFGVLQRLRMSTALPWILLEAALEAISPKLNHVQTAEPTQSSAESTQHRRARLVIRLPMICDSRPYFPAAP